MKKTRKIPKNVVGAKILKLRSQKGWTQDELATELQLLGWDCTRSKLAKIEARMVRVTDIQILYLSKALKVQLIELYFSTEPKKIDPSHSFQ